MVTLEQIENNVGCNFRFWGRPEIRELGNILSPGEVIAQCVNGHYKSGFALLCVTNHRLLLIDKKPMFLSLEDIRFDMITELGYSAQALNGMLCIMTPGRRLEFSSWSHARLRTILSYTQQRVTDIRQLYIQKQFQDVGRQESYTAPMAGNLAMQANSKLSFNPYSNVPITVRRSHVSKFYQKA
jgi:hypothetical protein